MYLVSFKEFKEFLDSENIQFEQTIITQTPCILLFKRGETTKGKVEVVDGSVFRWNNIHGLTSFKESKNKYWIRGKEWVKDASESQ
jgi:hypothetical protein